MKQIGQGAEAIVYEDDRVIVKDRVAKPYRLKVIDDALRKARTKKEAVVLKKLEAVGFPAPRIVQRDIYTLKFSKINGAVVRDVFEENYQHISMEIGEKIAALHNLDIIHGDLTTSNMILADEVYFIDFGLSFTSQRIEDKAVDLHLLRQALESKHYSIWEMAFKDVLKGYAKANQHQEILKRLDAVEARGRNKGKSG